MGEFLATGTLVFFAIGRASIPYSNVTTFPSPGQTTCVFQLDQSCNAHCILSTASINGPCYYQYPTVNICAEKRVAYFRTGSTVVCLVELTFYYPDGNNCNCANTE
jgi:hypothetical protein